MRFIMILAVLMVAPPGLAAGALASENEKVIPAGGTYFSDKQQMTYLRTVIAKLKETTKAMNDVAELEALGMPSMEIERLQGAMKIKSKQLTEEALVLIHAL